MTGSRTLLLVLAIALLSGCATSGAPKKTQAQREQELGGLATASAIALSPVLAPVVLPFALPSAIKSIKDDFNRETVWKRKTDALVKRDPRADALHVYRRNGRLPFPEGGWPADLHTRDSETQVIFYTAAYPAHIKRVARYEREDYARFLAVSGPYRAKFNHRMRSL